MYSIISSEFGLVLLLNVATFIADISGILTGSQSAFFILCSHQVFSSTLSLERELWKMWKGDLDSDFFKQKAALNLAKLE